MSIPTDLVIQKIGLISPIWDFYGFKHTQLLLKKIQTIRHQNLRNMDFT